MDPALAMSAVSGDGVIVSAIIAPDSCSSSGAGGEFAAPISMEDEEDDGVALFGAHTDVIDVDDGADAKGQQSMMENIPVTMSYEQLCRASIVSHLYCHHYRHYRSLTSTLQRLVSWKQQIGSRSRRVCLVE